MLCEFIDETGIYFFTTQMGKGVIDEEHSQCLGTAALSSDDYVHEAISQADLIINAGHDVVEKPPFLMKHGGAQVIHVNFSTATVDGVYFPQLEVVGDIANSIWRFTEAIGPQPQWDFGSFATIKKRIDAELEGSVSDGGFPMTPRRLVAEVRAAMPPDGIVALDNGMYKLWFARNYRAREPNTLLLDNALATMGAGLPSAMAAKMIYPERQVMAVCGDGGFLMNAQDLETAVRLGLNLAVVIVNDGGYGMIKWKQESMGLKSFGLDFGNPDFVQLAESFGATGLRIGSSEEFGGALRAAFDTPGVVLIDLPVDYSQNAAVLGGTKGGEAVSV